MYSSASEGLTHPRPHIPTQTLLILSQAHVGCQLTLHSSLILSPCWDSPHLEPDLLLQTRLWTQHACTTVGAGQ